MKIIRPIYSSIGMVLLLFILLFNRYGDDY
jgi:hypothetical protein